MIWIEFKSFLLCTFFYICSGYESCTHTTYCNDGYYCCYYNTKCCDYYSGYSYGTSSETLLGVGAIVGIVIGCIFFIALVIACICAIAQSGKRQGRVIQPQTTAQVTTIAYGYPQGHSQGAYPSSSQPSAFPPAGPAYPPPTAAGVPPPYSYNTPPNGYPQNKQGSV